MDFEFFKTNSPTYDNSGGALGSNDILRLTGGTPISTALGGGNTVNVLLEMTTLSLGNVFKGGIYEDQAASGFTSSISGAAYNFYVLGDGNGTHTGLDGTPNLTTGAVNPTGYYTLAEWGAANGLGPSLSMSVSTLAEQANFLSGTVNGSVMEFTVVPEPGTLLLLAAGLIGLLCYAWRKSFIPGGRPGLKKRTSSASTIANGMLAG